MNNPNRRESFASVWDAIVDTREEAAYLHMRSDLMGTITVLIEASGWTQAKAAHQLPAARPNLALLAGCIDKHCCGVGASGIRQG